MPRSARNTITLVADSGWARDQRTAVRIASGGQREPAEADAEVTVNVRRQGPQRKRCRPVPSRPWRVSAGCCHEDRRGITHGPSQPQTTSRDPLYRGYRSPAATISDAVWLCFRVALRHRDVEELLAERGVQVSDEAVRLWCRRLGPLFAGTLRRRRSRSADTWPLDEVQPKLKGKRHWRWRAVDRDGLVLDLLGQARRNPEAAERFLRRVLAGEGLAPRVVVPARLHGLAPWPTCRSPDRTQ
jgi:DDE domain